MNIPAGALDQDTEISIELVEAADLPTNVLQAVGEGPVWRLEPSGLRLNEPATISLKFDSGQLSDNERAGGLLCRIPRWPAGAGQDFGTIYHPRFPKFVLHSDRHLNTIDNPTD